MLALLLACACRGDATVPGSTSDDSVLLVGIHHTLVGPAGRRGTIQADSAVMGERLGTIRLIRPRLTLTLSATRTVPVEIAADAGTLDVATGVVRLHRPSAVSGAPATLMGRDTVLYDPEADSLRPLPGPGSDTTTRR
jgi:hypothetical protein